MIARAPRSPQPVRISPLVLLAVAIAAVIAWAIRDWAAYLDAGSLSSLSSLHQPLTAGHHGGSGGTSAFPPPIIAESTPNYAGITLLAAHLMVAGVLIATAVARQRRHTTRAVDLLIFATTTALLAALVTMPVAALTVGSAISSGNTLAAAVTVLQYSFVLSLVVAAVVDLRLATPLPREGDPRVEPQRRAQAWFGRRCGADVSSRSASVRDVR